MRPPSPGGDDADIKILHNEVTGEDLLAHRIRTIRLCLRVKPHSSWS